MEFERIRKKNLSRNFFLHIHDNRVAEYSLKPSFTLGFGAMLVSLFIILLTTGVLMMIYYVPSVDRAYGSVKDIIFTIPGGRYVRNLHRWSGHGMVLITFLHLARVLFTAGYSHGRGRNWIFGIIMFLLVMLMGFSGYLLPWDQLSYWAVTICSNIAASAREITDALQVTTVIDIGGWTKRILIGDDTVGQAALSRFYTLHVMILPVSMIFLTGYHFWRIRKDGGLNHPHKDKTQIFSSWPRLMWAELAVFTATLAIMITIATFIDAPLREEANPALPENPAKAPWYFLGIQELVSYSSFAGGILVPLLFIFFLVSIPYIDRDRLDAGAWFTGNKGRVVALYSAGLGFLLSAGVIILAGSKGWVRDWIDSPPILLLQLLNPGFLLSLIFIAWSTFILRKFRSRRFAVIAIFSAAMVALGVFTMTGIWLRGTDWKLVIFK